MRRLGSFLFILAAVCGVRAAPPADGVSFPPRGAVCRVNKDAMGRRIAALRAARAAGVLPSRNVNPAPRVLVIRVQFSDQLMGATLSETQALFDQVHDFYAENSYGVFLPTFTVTANLYSLGRPLSYYGADAAGDVAFNTGRLFDDAAAAAAGDAVFLTYDHVMVYHAGTGQESCKPDPLSGACTGLIWSLYLDQSKSAGGKTFAGFTAVPEAESAGLSPHGVICHEYGHQLGLPDLYDTDPPGKTSVGKWDLMDYPYGSTPADTPHLGAWSKYFLGFSAPGSSTGTAVLSPAETSPEAARLPHPSANDSFLMEYRRRASGTFDKGVPMAAGLALWRVDEGLVLGGSPAMENNVVNAPLSNGTGHAGVDLIEADGVPPGGDLGSGDLFTDGGTAAGDQTAAFDGTPSGLTIVAASGTGGPALTAQVLGFSASPSLAIARVVNFPNPGGDRARYPVRAGAAPGTVTTLVLQLSKPVSGGKIVCGIYDLRGKLVRALPAGAFSLRAGPGQPTGDGKWVYEHDWDGRTDDGGDAASGVYVCLVKIGDEVKTAKMVLVR